MPGILRPRGQYRGRAGRGCHPHHRAEIAKMRWRIQQHDRRCAALCQDRCAIDLPPPRDRDDTSLGRHRGQPGEHCRRHRLDQPAQLRPDIRGEAPDQQSKLIWMDGANLLERGMEADGMLDSMEPLEHR
jgi:hypothetical protein